MTSLPIGFLTCRMGLQLFMSHRVLRWFNVMKIVCSYHQMKISVIVQQKVSLYEKRVFVAQKAQMSKTPNHLWINE